jgi:hypothetical protein
VNYRLGIVDAKGVAEGQTDPVIGMIPIDQSGVAYHDILSIAVWRKPDIVKLVVALLVPLPIASLCFWAALDEARCLYIGLPFALLGAWMIYSALRIQKSFVRVAGRNRTINLRFDTPLRKRRRFHDELLRRAGLPPAVIP